MGMASFDNIQLEISKLKLIDGNKKILQQNFNLLSEKCKRKEIKIIDVVKILKQ